MPFSLLNDHSGLSLETGLQGLRVEAGRHWEASTEDLMRDWMRAGEMDVERIDWRNIQEVEWVGLGDWQEGECTLVCYGRHNKIPDWVA